MVIPAPINTALRAAAMLLFVVVIAACSRSPNDNVGLTGVGTVGQGMRGLEVGDALVPVRPGPSEYCRVAPDALYRPMIAPACEAFRLRAFDSDMP